MKKTLSAEHRKKLSIAQTKRMQNFSLRQQIGDTMRGQKGMGRPRLYVFPIKFLRREALKRDDHTCQICGLREPQIMEVDHIKPRSRFPELVNELGNLVTLCPNCHKRKTVRNRENTRFHQKK